MCNRHFCRGRLFLNNSDCVCFILCSGTDTVYDSFLSHASSSKETTHILQCNKAREVHFRLRMKQSSRIFIHSVEGFTLPYKTDLQKKKNLLHGGVSRFL